MGYIYILAICFLASLSVSYGQSDWDLEEQKCPKHWIQFYDSCYRFIRSSFKKYDEAREACRASQSDLISLNSDAEQAFILKRLISDDLQSRWYTGVRFTNGDWYNEADSTRPVNIDKAFLPVPNDYVHRDYLAYAYSDNLRRWGLEKVTGQEELLYICEASVRNLHATAEDERDYQYGIDIDDPRRIPRGPYFIRQPENTVYFPIRRTEVNNVTLRCLAGGYPSPTYEWFGETYDNGSRLMSVPINPLENPKYIISGGNLVILEPQQRSEYRFFHCKAENEYGAIISESAELSHGYILEFNFKRSEETGEQNYGKVMYCDTPEHHPAIQYVWSRNIFQDFVEQDRRVFVSNDGAIYFSALEPIDAANYSCNVQSYDKSRLPTLGRNGPFFPLKVIPYGSFQQLKFPNSFPKVFPEAPIVGQSVRLECVAFGYPVPSYNWVRSNGSLPPNAALSSYNRVLTINNVRMEDQGEYTCRVHNDRLSIMGNVFISIQAEPNFTIPLEDKHMDKNGEVSWTCEAFGIPSVTYTWFKNGELLDPDYLPENYRDRYFIRDNHLRITKLRPEIDTGMYQCRARNQLKARYSSAQLRVLSFKPSFKKHPMESETYAAEHGNVTLRCNPEAAPRPTFTWRLNGNVLGSGQRKILPNGNLWIERVSTADEGTYDCLAENMYGRDETRGRLIVLRGPKLLEPLPRRIITAVMNNHTLWCQADIDPKLDLAYIWKHNGKRIRNKDLMDNPRWKIDGGRFDLINITLSDAGEYECIMQSTVESISTNTTLIVDGPPGPPGGLQVNNIEKLSATLEWADGALNGRPIIMYAVSARTGYSNQWFNLTQNITAMEKDRTYNRKEAHLERILNPFTTYEFRVSAANELGYGPPSTPSPKFSTPPAKPTRVPTNIGEGDGKQNELQIVWDPLPPEYQNGRNVYYKVYWRRKGHDTEFQTQLLREYGNIGKYTAKISRDYYYTEYEVRVQPFNEIGEGPISDIVTIHSAEDMPTKSPITVVAYSYNSTALNVTWDALEESRDIIRGKLIGYRIKYWRELNREVDSIFYLSRTRRPWSLIVGLQFDTYYRVRVMAYNKAGAGPESEFFRVRTYRKAPQNAPTSVFIYDKNPSTVRVVWRYVQPTLNEEPIDGFKIRVWQSEQDMSSANDTIVPLGSKLEAYIDNLTPGETYVLRVLAFSKGGDGRMSSPERVFQMGDPKMFRNNASYNILNTGIIIAVVFIMSQLNFI